MLEIRTYGDVLHVFVNDAAAMKEVVRLSLAATRVPLNESQPTTPRGEAAFISMIRRRQQDSKRLPNNGGKGFQRTNR